MGDITVGQSSNLQDPKALKYAEQLKKRNELNVKITQLTNVGLPLTREKVFELKGLIFSSFNQDTPKAYEKVIDKLKPFTDRGNENAKELTNIFNQLKSNAPNFPLKPPAGYAGGVAKTESTFSLGKETASSSRVDLIKQQVDQIRKKDSFTPSEEKVETENTKPKETKQEKSKTEKDLEELGKKAGSIVENTKSDKKPGALSPEEKADILKNADDAFGEF